MIPNSERRKRTRMALRWPVCLTRTGERRSIESRTENLSSQGLYCISPEPFAPGERLDCVLTVPAAGWGYDAALLLHCLVEVARLETTGDDSGFGLGLKIEAFTLMATRGEGADVEYS